MPAGRPTVYTPELLEKARRYVDNYEDFDDPVPTVAGLACVIGVTRETCHVWARDEDKAEFSNILGKLMQAQERGLVRGGLKSDFNASIAKMMLTKHGYSDAVDNRHTSPDGSMSPNPAADWSKAPPEVLEWVVSQGDAAKPD